jgi:hypothetical protein
VAELVVAMVVDAVENTTAFPLLRHGILEVVDSGFSGVSMPVALR